MPIAKVFQSGNSQAIRIPKETQTNQKEFSIHKIGDGYILSPINDPWFPLKRSIGKIPSDFMNERNQPTWQQLDAREEF